MLPRKKLEYYAKKNGIEDFSAIRLSDDDCRRICEAVGSNVYGMDDTGGKISELIDRVMDDAKFKAKHANPSLPEDFMSARLSDYAAEEVMKNCRKA